METVKIQSVNTLVDVPLTQPDIKERKRPMFTGNEDHEISLNDASELTHNYRSKQGKDAIKGGFFGLAAIQQLLDQEGVVGLRYYYAQEADGRPVLILVGVDANGNDLVDGFLLERSVPCPPFCGWLNSLNS